MNLQRFLVESTWGYPVISAIHVLAIAWFGGAVLAANLRPDLRRFRRVGLILLLVTGVLMFWLHPGQYYHSVSFRVKILMLLALAWTKPASPLSIALWIAVIFASRGIAFW